MAPLMSLQGKSFNNAQVELYEDRLMIRYSKARQYDIPIKAIVGIRSSPPGLLWWGSLHFSTKGDNGPVRDEHYVLFNNSGAGEAEKLRQKLEEMVKAASAGDRSATPAQAGMQVPPYAGEIEKLADLKARGIITGAEFEAKKQQLLFGGGSGPVLREREIIKEIVKVPCPYCGLLMDVTSSKCPGCGAPMNRR